MKIRDLFLPRAIVPALALLAACSNTRTKDGAESSMPANAAPIGATPVENWTGTAQDPQDIEKQRRQLAVQKALEEARRAMQFKFFEDAQRHAMFVLEMEPSNQAASEILLSANELLGNTRTTPLSAFEQRVLGQQVALQRELDRTRTETAVGDAHIEAGRYGDAIETYERALVRLKASLSMGQARELQTTVEAKLKTAKDLKVKAEQDAIESRRAASQKDIEDAERKLKIQRETRVSRLLVDANLAFQAGNFERAVENLNFALREEPNNRHAQELRDLAERGRHTSRMDVLRQDWIKEWSATFDDLNASDVVQTDSIRYDIERWTKVSQTKPFEFTPPSDLESPEEKAILEKLKATRLEHTFGEATINDWAQHYSGVTNVTFWVSPAVAALAPEATTLRNFKLPTRSVFEALETIGATTGVRWVVRNGMVHLVTPENARGKTYLMQYPVGDLVQGVPSKPGRELRLRAPGDEEAPAEEDAETKPTVVDETKLVDMIRANVSPDAWDPATGGGSIDPQKGVLLVRQSKEVHEAINKLLNDLRQAVGIQVDVETRFLKVEDSFLEDIGVDFRGLGNQASEGLAGRGLERNNRANTGFDDFGTRQQVNPATPGPIGTGTEPGIFFDDGQDGDLLARTENLFDRTLGGQGRLDNAGGLALQYAYLDDAELEVVVRAVAKQERSEEITAPRLLIYNNTRASMQVLRQTSYIRDFEVEIAQAAAVANPVVDVIKDGVVLDVRPVVSADRKFITMELRPSVMTLRLPIPTFVTTLGVGQPVTIQLPETTLQRVRTTVTMPDGGTMMLGGMKLAEKQDQVSGVPVLKDLPIVSFLFSRKGTFVQNMKVLILIRAKIILPAEHEPLLPLDDTTILTGTK